MPRPKLIEVTNAPEITDSKKRTEYNLYFTSEKENLDFIPFGCACLDCILGGGWVLGRVGNIIGDRSSGKTLLAIEAAANFAKKYPDGKIFYRESEAAFDVEYAAALGMPIDRVDFGEDIDFQTIEDFDNNLEDELNQITKKNVPGLYIVDSLDGLTDTEELKREMGEGTYGTGKAKKLSELFRKRTQDIAKADMVLLVVSQIRDRIGVTFGDKTTRSGGHALDFYATHIIKLAQLELVRKTHGNIKRPIGIKVKARCTKNKISLPFRECEFDIIFGMGVDDLTSGIDWIKEIGRHDALSFATEKEMISWYRNNTKWTDQAYWQEVARVNSVVTELWQESEQAFLPQRSKYKF